MSQSPDVAEELLQSWALISDQRK